MGAVGYTPAVEVTGAGATLINSRLVDWEHVDASGVESDTLKLTVNIEGVDSLPSFDGKIGLKVGYEETGLVDKGEFIITRTTPQLFPALLLIVATAAPFKVSDETGFKSRRSESYGPITLGALFRQIAQKHGFSPRVSPELDGLQIDHVEQSNETDAGFLTRLARRYDAVAKPFNDLYVLARRGQLKTLSGKPMPPVTLSVTKDNRPGDRSFIAASMDQDSRVKFKGCKTTWWDGGSGKECIVEVGAEPFKKVRQRYQNEAEAKAAAEGEQRKIQREAMKIRIDCPGNPAFGAEGLLDLDGSWPSFMQGSWSIDKVTANGSRQQSYRCTIEASQPAS
ncbi:contractile injection system protein, VgrG/Pvc8 family [Pseudomonas alloputida]|uniref:contractile injection system protein, VgrG/Pvc8 family n=1 Tax=Pseudomonas alloputida TaxID=1940621 RepID=UPI001E4B27B8|nr:contractile injection system protein, VgrG/Pvc8 family [Pseudomonas alloputida]MCE0871067.1 phage late control D family protein [Pseudomonas alloputida]